MNSDIEIYSDSDQDYRRPSTFGKKGGGGSSVRRGLSDEFDEIDDLGTPPGEVEEDDEEQAPRSRPQKGGSGKSSGSKNRTGGGASTAGFTSASRLKASGSGRIGSSTSVANKPGARRFVVDEDSEDDEHDDTPAFKPETIQGIFKGVWSNPDTRVHKDAMKLSAEFLRLFTIEALHRAVAYQREQEEDDLLRDDEMLLDVDSLEAITPQLLLDF